MKKIQKLILIASFIGLGSFCRAPLAGAAVFIDTVDFADAVHATLGYTYKDIPDNLGFAWMHDIRSGFDGHALDEITLLEAWLSLTYAKTEGNEEWFLPGLGPLAVTAESPTTSIFTLNANALAGLQASGLFEVRPLESTVGRDTLRLVESTLSGYYRVKTAAVPEVPEPLSALLMMIGMGAGLSRRMLKK